MTHINFIIITIIITVFSLIALPNQNKADPIIAKKASSIQYGYKKSGTRACVLYQTLALLNKNETHKQRKNERHTFPREAYLPNGVATPRT